jgi:dienelactone hydrolase
MKLRADRTLARVMAAVLCAQVAQAGPHTATFAARDTLRIAPDASADAQAMLDALAYAAGEFSVTCVANTRGVTVQFPSPRPRRAGDMVTMEWHVARDAERRPIVAPAVLVIHTIHPEMPIGRAVARGLAAQGFHAFMMQMPGFGRRWHPDDERPEAFFPRMVQAVADARRARDAIAVLPNVAPGPIAIQGTSLGGIVAVNAASLDSAFGTVMLVITGGELRTIVETGEADAAFVRMRLQRGGIVGDVLAAQCHALEPTRIAHRLPADRTWLVAAVDDVVIPPQCTEALARAIGLADTHRINVPGNHYTVITRFPAIIEQLAAKLPALPPPPED